MQASSPITLASAPRIGAPPLRFKGWFLTHHARAHGTQPKLFLELWKRQRGGFTVMFSRWHDQKWQADAMTAESLHALMEDIETHCASLSAANDAPDDTTYDQFLQSAQRRQDLADFFHLVGHALDEWDILNAEHGATQPQNHDKRLKV